MMAKLCCCTIYFAFCVIDFFGLKVYYHLGAFEESVTYALGAGSLFDVISTSEYVETIVGK